jgi:hypothetical protein
MNRWPSSSRAFLDSLVAIHSTIREPIFRFDRGTAPREENTGRHGNAARHDAAQRASGYGSKPLQNTVSATTHDIGGGS